LAVVSRVGEWVDVLQANPVDRYASAVVAGTIPAGKYHRLACVRHLKDRARENSPGFPFRFEWPKAEKFLKFARLMKHYKGRQFAGQPFEPTDFQVFRLGSVFGWRHVTTGLRRFTTAYNEVPRKQGKSFEAAVVGVYVTFFEGEPGAEGYCIATKEKQARIVFDAMKRLVKSSGLGERIKVNAANLHREATASKLEPLGSDSDTTDGLNPHLIVVDEMHAFKTRGLLDVMESATGARVNPLNFQITTAGDDPVSPGGDQHDYACRILDGVLEDDPSTVAFFACIAHADEDDDWLDERTWKKANPHWGISINPEDMHKLAAKAAKMPAAAAEFQQKRLGWWVNASAPCLSIEGWRRGQSSWSPEDLRGESCFVGLDLASKIDLAGLSVTFPPTELRPSWRWLQYIWSPADTLKDRAHRDRAPYPVWADQGWLRLTPGVRINHRVVLEALESLRSMFSIEAVGYDPWHVDKLADELLEMGFDEERLREVPQTYAGMSAACLDVQADTLSGLIDARGCPVTAWCVSNVVANIDGKENLMFAKGKSRGRIDPVIAGTIGRALWLRREAPEGESIYEKRAGLATIGGAR
jgi:phage terminase large subunit-like protein